jgi:hypothetical protein
MNRLLIVLALLCAAAPAAAQSNGVRGIAGVWDRGPTAGTPFRSTGSGPGPVMRLQSSGDGDEGGVGGAPRGDHTAPILQPWAADVVRRRVEQDSAGRFQAEPKESCSPMGVPHILQLNGPITVLVTPDTAVILYMRQMHARIVHLNQKHPAGLKPSYYGHSVGHWEGGTLVVDTVALNDKTPVDIFGTPHTGQLHVLERYHVIDGGKALRVDFTVEDPGAFTSPWSSFAEYGAPREPYAEQVCAENNRLPDGSLVPGPRDDTPDF